ncbi:MAG: ferrous iron transport protein A [bacterium]|nr:ferrous iron transport protein A [bacterium]
MSTTGGHSSDSTEPVSLRAFRAGDVGLITRLDDTNGTTRRLAEFGLVRGATVEMLRAGSPCILRIEHTRLSVGAALQDSVHLAPLK